MFVIFFVCVEVKMLSHLGFGPKGNFYNTTKDLFQEIKCEIKGKRWLTCIRMWGPCGCVTVYKDGGKACRNGKDCSANYCVVSGYLSNDNDSYVGRCPSDSSIGGCGYANIEDGKVVPDSDDRMCRY